MSGYVSLPPQQLPKSQKGKKWRMKNLDWADSKSFFNYNAVRKSIEHKKINYDLINGKLYMSDLAAVINPSEIKAEYIPEKIQHYPIINSKLNVLRGEESKRSFDYKVVVTNPTAVSEVEQNKKNAVFQILQEFVQDQQQSTDEANQRLTDIDKYFTYEWQDMREMRANALLSHYIKELDVRTKLNEGFYDALICGEEIYRCSIVAGEPTFERLNPMKVSVFRSGSSNKIEDADIIIIEDYLPVGKIYDIYGEYLTKKDWEYLENNPDNKGDHDDMDNYDERAGFVNMHMVDDAVYSKEFYFEPGNLFDTTTGNSLMPFDPEGNVRVLNMYWKSRRKIKKVKSYDPITGEEIYNFYNEDYIIDESKGEEETVYYINEAWEGTKIGKNIYVNMRPMPIQYNRLSNPSICNFGIVGTIYNTNDSKPYSMVDMMKPYSYLYDIIHDKLINTMANNSGKMIQLDFAKMPAGWTVDKWMYFAKVHNIAVVNSFNEGNAGASQGKLAGALNNNNTGTIDVDLSSVIAGYINLLAFVEEEMATVVGISKQREGQVSNRETVGGVERATLQSSHITEYYFINHDNTTKRVLTTLLETAKIALKGRSKKFEYILPDFAVKMIDIDGDELAECDYGLVVDGSDGTQAFNQQLNAWVQAALQNQAISFSSAMKMFSSVSFAEKQRMIEKEEQERAQQAQQQAQMQLQAQQEQMQAQMQLEQQKLELENTMNIRDNETKFQIAQMQAENGLIEQNQGQVDTSMQELDIKRQTLDQKRREFDAKMNLEREKLNLERKKAETDRDLKKEQISVQRINKSKSSSK